MTSNLQFSWLVLIQIIMGIIAGYLIAQFEMPKKKRKKR